MFLLISAFLLFLDKMYIMSLLCCIVAALLLIIYVKISEVN
ncbi:hypothetical protein VPHD480_0076 [Vibrio phage D480]